MSIPEKEIGGYFGLEQLISREYYPGLKKLNSARNALLYLLKARNIRKLYIPYFLCDTVSALCDRYGYVYEYYFIDKAFLPVFDKKLSDNEWLYVVNFYGQLDNEAAQRLKEKYGNIIFDNVQAFFQKPAPGVDTIYSCRKFFGVPDGAYLATDANLNETLPVDSSKDRMKHILGRFEDTGSAYYSDFQENDEGFYTLELREMSALTRNILGAIDYEAVRTRRNQNYQFLAAVLDYKNRLQLKAPEGAYCYPFYCENGMQVKKALAAQKIYVATLWPNVLDMDAPFERELAANILPLPCDQRYDTEDMQRILDTLKQYI